MDLVEAMRLTPAVREFQDRAVEPALLEQILEVARFAPSGGNRQGWHVILVSDPEIRRQLRDLYVMGWREYMAHAERGLVPFAPGPDGSWHGPAVDLEAARAKPQPHVLADRLDRVPVLLIVTVELGALAVTDNGLNRQSIVGGASIYPFVHNILLAATTHGLGGVMTTVLTREEDAVRSLLAIPRGHALAAAVALGYPLKRPRRLRRLPVGEFTTRDTFDGPPFSADG